MNYTFILSDETINSYGFKVLTSGIDTSVFDANPVMLYEHKSIDLIGLWTKAIKEGKAIKADAQFDEHDELAQKIRGKVERGILKGVSIGFQILETAQERLPDGTIIPVVTRCKLMEASLCALPSNSNALRLYNEKGRLMEDAEMRLTISKLTHTQQSNPANNPTATMKLTADNLKALNLQESFTDLELNESLTALQKRLSTSETALKEINKERITSLVAGAVTAGKIKAEQTEHYEKLAAVDFDGVKSILDAMKASSKPNQHLTQNNDSNPADRAGWDFNKWRKEDPKGLARLRTENPEGYKTLLAGSDVTRHISA